MRVTASPAFVCQHERHPSKSQVLQLLVNFDSSNPFQDPQTLFAELDAHDLVSPQGRQHRQDREGWVRHQCHLGGWGR
jgi:hypothetical protein